MSRTLVGDIMSEAIITCREEDILGEVVANLSDAEVSALVIVNEADEAVGIISQMDLIKLYDKDWIGEKARDMMIRDIITTTPDTPVSDAARTMTERSVHRLIVTDKDGKCVGVLSITDVVRDMRAIYREGRYE